MSGMFLREGIPSGPLTNHEILSFKVILSRIEKAKAYLDQDGVPEWVRWSSGSFLTFVEETIVVCLKDPSDHSSPYRLRLLLLTEEDLLAKLEELSG